MDKIESGQKPDIARATVWAIGQVSEGGYLKTGIYSTAMDKSYPLFAELEGGWWITKHFSLGLNLKPGITQVKSLNSHVVLVGLILGYRNSLSNGIPFVIDFNTGSLDVRSPSSSRWYYEPSFKLLRRDLFHTRHKINGVLSFSYRFIQKNTSNDQLAEKLAGPGITLSLTAGSY